MIIKAKEGLRYVPKSSAEAFKRAQDRWQFQKAWDLIEWLPAKEYKVIRKRIDTDQLTYSRLVGVWIENDGDELYLSKQYFDIVEASK